MAVSAKCLGNGLLATIFLGALAWVIIGSVMLAEKHAIEDYPDMFCRRWSINDVRYSHEDRIATVSTCAGLVNNCLTYVVVHVPGTKHPSLVFESGSVRDFMEQNSIERTNLTDGPIRCAIECKKDCFTSPDAMWATTHTVEQEPYETMIGLSIIPICGVIAIVGREWYMSRIEAAKASKADSQTGIILSIHQPRSAHALP